MRYPSTRLAAAVQHLVRSYKARLGIDIHLDHQKLQAVLFLMHAKGLCTVGKSVFEDRPVVGEHGPIFRGIFDQLHSGGDASIVDVVIDTPKANKRGRAHFKRPALSDANVWSLLEATLEDYVRPPPDPAPYDAHASARWTLGTRKVAGAGPDF